MSDKYNERVRAIACEMAKERYPKHWGQSIISSVDAAFWQQETESYINDFLPEARIAVAHMAAAYEMGRKKGYELGIAWSEGKPITITPKFELISEGLIPDSAQEGAENESR